MIYFNYIHLLLGIAVLAATLIFLAKQKRSPWYLFFFSVFGIYLLFIVRMIVFPIILGDYTEPFKPGINDSV